MKSHVTDCMWEMAFRLVVTIFWYYNNVVVTPAKIPFLTTICYLLVQSGCPVCKQGAEFARCSKAKFRCKILLSLYLYIVYRYPMFKFWVDCVAEYLTCTPRNYKAPLWALHVYRGLIFRAFLTLYMFFKSALMGESFATVSQPELKFHVYCTPKAFPILLDIHS